MAIGVFGLLALAISAVVVVVAVLSRPASTDGPYCGHCRYDLTGCPSNRCPECGRLFIDAGVVLPKRRRFPWLVVGGAIGVLMIALLIGAIGLMAARRAAMDAQRAAAIQQAAAMQALRASRAASQAAQTRSEDVLK